MKAKLFGSILVTTIVVTAGPHAQKPRIFITESSALLASGEATLDRVNGSLAFNGGTSPQNTEAIRTFAERCPGVIVTADRNKAEYVVRLDHEAISPTTPFVHGNKVAVFDRNDDLLYSKSTRTLNNAVKGACAAITSTPPKEKANN